MAELTLHEEEKKFDFARANSEVKRLKNLLYIDSKDMRYKGKLNRYERNKTNKVVNEKDLERFPNLKVGEIVKWDSNRNAPWDNKAAISIVNKESYKTATPKKDIKFLEAKIQLEKDKASRPDLLRKTFSQKLLINEDNEFGTVYEREREQSFKDREEKLDSLRIGTNYERKPEDNPKFIEGASQEWGQDGQSSATEQLDDYRREMSKSDPNYGLSADYGGNELSIENAKKILGDGLETIFNPNGRVNVGGTQVEGPPVLPDEETGDVTEQSDKSNLTISKPGERYQGDDKRFINKDGQGERIIGGGASYGIGRKQWSSMTKAEKRGAKIKAMMIRKRNRQGG